MPKRGIVVTVLAVVVVLVAGGVAIGLLSGDERAAAPAGYVTHEIEVDGHRVNFAYPRAWGDVESRTEQGVQIVEVRGPAEAGLRPGIRLAANPGTTTPFEPHYAILAAQAGVTNVDLEEISAEDVEVPGAGQAKRRVVEHTRRDANGAERRLRQSAIFAQSDDALFVTLVVQPAPGGSEPDVDAVLASLRLDG